MGCTATRGCLPDGGCPWTKLVYSRAVGGTGLCGARRHRHEHVTPSTSTAQSQQQKAAPMAVLVERDNGLPARDDMHAKCGSLSTSTRAGEERHPRRRTVRHARTIDFRAGADCRRDVREIYWRPRKGRGRPVQTRPDLLPHTPQPRHCPVAARYHKKKHRGGISCTSIAQPGHADTHTSQARADHDP